MNLLNNLKLVEWKEGCKEDAPLLQDSCTTLAMLVIMVPCKVGPVCVHNQHFTISPDIITILNGSSILHKFSHCQAWEILKEQQ